MSKIIRGNLSGSIELTPHFYLAEFTSSHTAERLGIDNTPDPLAVKNLFALARMMERIRALLGNRIISISSGFRSAALNVAIGGVFNSDHMRGEACDFVCRGFGTPLQVAKKIANSDIEFGQLIQEGSWVHISLPRPGAAREVLTATFADGRASYRSGL